MRLFANLFSRTSARLLIAFWVYTASIYGDSMNSLKTNNLSDDQKMRYRNEIPLEDQWNVALLYSDKEAWKQDFLKVLGREKAPHWPELKDYQGRLQDPAVLGKLLNFYFDLDRKLTKLYIYAHLRLDEDLGNDDFKHNFGIILSLIHDFQLEASWIEPEILALSEGDFEKILASHSMKPFHFYLEKLRRIKPHTLSPELEETIALSSQTLGAPAKAFFALNNADLVFKSVVDSKGKTHPLSAGTYHIYLKSPDRTLRKAAFENLHQGYETHINTIAELFQGQVQNHFYLARVRKFESCLEAALFPNNVDPLVYENLISSVRKKLPLMHEYIALRKEVLGLDKVYPYDLYVPMIEEPQTQISYSEARDLVVESVAPLGKSYQASLQKGLFEERWVDVYENARKRSGAYSSGCYDSLPYILMNYNGTLNDVFTVAHEAGHSMHSLLSHKNQPYIYSEYPIFVAEVASTFNEQLLLKHLKAKAKTKKELAYLLEYEMERIRATLFRQTLFAEFERKAHQWIEEGTPLTPTILKKYYLELNQDYYGPELVLSPELEVEWARIPHFYSNFYVYQYATGLSAALTLFQKVTTSEKAKEGYLEFLSSGGSKYPLDLLKRAGVDMKDPSAVDQALDYFAALLEELKECLKEI